MAAVPTFTLLLNTTLKSVPAVSFLPSSVTVYAGFTALPVYTWSSTSTTACAISTSVISNFFVTDPINPLPCAAFITAPAVPTFVLSVYVTSNAVIDVTAVALPSLLTVIILTAGLISDPVYSNESFSSTTSAVVISTGFMANVVLTEPVFLLIPFACIVAVPSLILSMYTSS